MSAPIQAGDQCRVIAGLGRSKSPNVGLHVTVRSLQGEHSVHGRVWRCEGQGVQQLNDGGGYDATGWADFPAAWLIKAEAPPLSTTTTTTKEVTA